MPPVQPNETGRREGDPSLPLLQLIGRLQHTKPDDHQLVRVGPALYAEAVTMILKRGAGLRASRFWLTEGFASTLFCDHWISPLEAHTAEHQGD